MSRFATPRRSAVATPAATGAAPVTTVERRTSLSRGPALVLGTILLAAGLYFLYRGHFFPRFGNFPNGRAPVEHDAFFGIFGINGWTGMLTAIAGGLLLFGAAEHFLSKTMSLIVGCALAAAAIIALISGDVLGLAAANGWTELGWGVCAAILLLNVLIPRHRRVVETGAAAGYATDEYAGSEYAGTAAGGAGTTATGRRGPFTRTRRITGAPTGAPADGTVPADGAALDEPATAATSGRTATPTREL